MESMTLNEWAKEIDQWCDRKGWNNGLVLGNAVANLHTEISEAWEEIRDGRLPDELYHAADGKPLGFGVEIADLIIRALHLCAHYGINIDALLAEKMAYNEKRPYRHGGKTA